MNRKLLALLLVVPLALVAVAAAVARLVPADRVAALAAARAEAALGRDVRIERVAVDLLPTPGIALDGVAIAGASADAVPLATVRRAVLRPKLLPLLARRVVVDAVTLERPRLLVVVDSAGVTNLPTFAEGEPDPAAGEKAGGDIAFLIDRFEIRGGRIAYRDERTGTAVRLDGLDQRLRLEGVLRDGALSRIGVEGELDVEALGAVLPGKLAVPIENVRLHVEHEAVLDRPADSLALERLAVRIQELALEGQGMVRRVTNADGRDVSLRLVAGPVDVGALVRSLPHALLDRMAPEGAEFPDVGGTARLDVAAEGPLGKDALPRVTGTLALDAFRLAWDGKGDLLSGLDGRIRFTLDSLASDGMDGRLLGRPFHIALAVRDAAAPIATARIRTTLDLERATALGLVPDSLGLRGAAGIDLTVNTPLLEPGRGAVNGTVTLAGITAAPPSLRVPLRVEDGRLLFRGRRLTSEALRLRLGESDLAIDLAAEDWLPLALGDSTVTPTANVDIRSRLLDADAILAEANADTSDATYADLFFARLADRPVDGRPAGEVAEEAGFGLPPLPPVDLAGRFRAGTLRRNGIELQDVDVAFTGNGDRLEVTDARFGLMGGGVQVTGRIGLAAEGSAAQEAAGFPTVLSYQLRDVGAAEFFDRLTPFREHLTGSLVLAGTARMVLDRNLLPIRESVMAEGSIAVSDGRLANWPALRALSGKLGLAQFDTLTLRDWTGRFRVTGPTVTIAESLLESDELSARAAGAFDFAGTLDLTATLLLEPTLTGRIRGELGPRLAALAGDDGTVPVGLEISGPAQRPDVRLDLSAAAENAVARARAAAEDRARELAEQAARQAAARLLPGDSLTAAPADSVRTRLEAELRNRLRRLIRTGN
ncbi:MAG TPA: AsmA family protein [Longimicrobiales bacterium]